MQAEWRYQPRIGRWCWTVLADDVVHMIVKHENPDFHTVSVCDAVPPGHALIAPTLLSTRLDCKAFPGLTPMSVNSTPIVVHTLPAVAGWASTLWKCQGATIDAW